MISKENSALIFDPKFFVKLEIYKQTRILLFHLKNMKYSQRCPCLWRENLLSYDNMLGFFQMLRRSKDVIFHENKYSQNSALLVQKIICLILNN